MPAVYQQRDGFSIFDKGIAADFVEMERNDKEAQSPLREKDARKKKKKLGWGGGGGD